MMKLSELPVRPLALITVLLAGCNFERQEKSPEEHKVIVTTPMVKSVTITQRYVCQIHSRRHIEVCALERGYLEDITVKEGQSVKKGDVIFRILPIIYKSKLDAELAEQALAQMEFEYSQKLSQDKVISTNELALEKAKLARAKAKAELAQAELNFATIRAPFDGIIDRQRFQEGSLVEEGGTLTTLSDNDVMWVYFNVPEAIYLDYMAELNQQGDDLKIELLLANGKKFAHTGSIGAIEADFNNKTGNISFRADFPNPDRILRHGQTGNILISRERKDALVIPQRATFQILADRFVYVIDKDNVARQRGIEIENELDDVFVIKSGLDVNTKIIFEGGREVRDGDKVKYEDRKPEEIFANLKYHAE